MATETAPEPDDDGFDDDEYAIEVSREPYPVPDYAPPTVAYPTEYMVTALPDDHLDARTWAVWVKDRGHGKYAVCLHQNSSGQEVLTADGRWVWEPRPSSRSDEFIALTRFDLFDALRLAKEQASRVRWNGLTAADILRREAAARP